MLEALRFGGPAVSKIKMILEIKMDIVVGKRPDYGGMVDYKLLQLG